MRDRRRTPAGEVQAEKQQRYVQLITLSVYAAIVAAGTLALFQRRDA